MVVNEIVIQQRNNSEHMNVQLVFMAFLYVYTRDYGPRVSAGELPASRRFGFLAVGGSAFKSGIGFYKWSHWASGKTIVDFYGRLG